MTRSHPIGLDGRSQASTWLRDPVLIVRGDLTSLTGYGAATRSLSAILRRRFPLNGVDLHPEHLGESATFPGLMASDDDIHRFAANGGRTVIVLNYTTPDKFIYVPGAINIGCFYWETSVIPFSLGWRERIAAMDFMWAPSTYIQRTLIEMGYLRPVAIVTWPLEFKTSVPANSTIQDHVSAMVVSRLGDSPRELSLAAMRAEFKDIVLTVKSLAPRKGLPVLISEWRDFVQSTERSVSLLLKLRFVHNTRLAADKTAHLLDMLAEAGFGPGDPINIGFITEDLEEETLSGLYDFSDGYITTSYGEGFGGPVVEALLRSRPVIAAHHTGVQDLLPPDYPLIFPTHSKRVELRGNPEVYPHAATWEVPVRGGVRAALERFVQLSAADRLDLSAQARAHASKFCSIEAVERQVDGFLRDAGLAAR